MAYVKSGAYKFFKLNEPVPILVEPANVASHVANLVPILLSQNFDDELLNLGDGYVVVSPRELQVDLPEPRPHLIPDGLREASHGRIYISIIGYLNKIMYCRIVSQLH